MNEEEAQKILQDGETMKAFYEAIAANGGGVHPDATEDPRWADAYGPEKGPEPGRSELDFLKEWRPL